MQTGAMAADGYFPSSAGTPLGGMSLLGGYQADKTFICSLSVSGTPGSSPTYQMESLVTDQYGSQWVPVANLVLSGTGQVTGHVVGDAVRLNAANGGTYTASAASYAIETFASKESFTAKYPFI